ncbi:Zinc-finger domain of monoamine-oxidase A repressor R1 [Cynara cardunculus var. scolymus]|uniref:Zinc-finger domain of monoamine-oxidase A repressor R1 n=1 Tax=Cynara cardunculus var. scolymus TaxID=59895 RepID=A0A118K0V6_CYNCS|nr:Zinc-finger domain of monoamine-oxidase A repressor R1 [Cynara cardunculus var. scolymus]
MVSKKKRRDGNGSEKENDEGKVAEYEQSREQRIKENLQRMHKLGILELSRNLKPPPKPKTIRSHKPVPPVSGSPRRSSRLKTMPTVSYSEKRVPNSKDKPIKDVKIEIKKGSQPEVYTEEHEKMLGDHKETWTLYVDGYDGEGNRIYDTYEGKSCHQCRQKTAGLRTTCCKCNQGQFCGDCLFTRYAENISEVNADPNWVCPVCRDICNCSRCRRLKGWEPTGNVYRKVNLINLCSALSI